MISDALLDAVLDCVKMLPFLFLAFFLLEALEHRVSGKMNDFLTVFDRADLVVQK
jgi:hypothetical protein